MIIAFVDLAFIALGVIVGFSILKTFLGISSTKAPKEIVRGENQLSEDELRLRGIDSPGEDEPSDLI